MRFDGIQTLSLCIASFVVHCFNHYNSVIASEAKQSFSHKQTVPLDKRDEVGCEKLAKKERNTIAQLSRTNSPL
ncbi:MAG: hypothetical protein U0586_09490 [Candidatus Brocadiaceae bacterium]